MAQIATAFWVAGSQAVRLPQEFWFEGGELRIERLGSLIVLSPISGPSVRPCDWPAAPPPHTTFSGFLEPHPTPGRLGREAEVRWLFPRGCANDNEPAGRAGVAPALLTDPSLCPDQDLG